jgi:hypothetical protein
VTAPFGGFLEKSIMFLRDKKVQESVQAVENLGPEYRGLMDSIERYGRSAADVNVEFKWEGWSTLQPMGDQFERTHTLLLTLAWDLLAIRRLIVFDVDQLLELIDIGLTTHRFRFVVLGVRALLERAAIAERHFKSVRESCQQVEKFPCRQFLKGQISRESYKKQIGPRLNVVKVLSRYFNAQSFNWAVFATPDQIGEREARQKNIELAQFHAGPSIKALEWTGPYVKGTDLHWWYNLLCDYVHPNYGARVLFVDIKNDEDVLLPNKTINRLHKIKFSRRPTDMSALNHVVGIIYLALRESLSRTSSQIDWLATEQRKYYRDLRTLERGMGFSPSLSQ